LIFSKIVSETFVILRRTGWDMIKNVFGIRIKSLLFLQDFYEN